MASSTAVTARNAWYRVYRGVAPAAALGATDHAIYLDHLYRQPESPPLEPTPGRELMLFYRALKWGLLIFLFVVCFVLLTWLFVRPIPPLLNVASADIENVHITEVAATAQCNITLLFTNPNRHLTAVYDRIEISLVYAAKEVLLSQFHQPLIVQHKRTQLTFQTNLSFSAVNLGNGVVSAMKQDLDRGTLGFGIKISSVIKYKSGIWKTKSHLMRAYCGGVSFAFTSSNKPGIFLNPYQECQVYVYSK